MAGKSFSRGALYQMLQNRVYRGEIVHKGAAYPGEHPPIVDEELWRRVQEKLEANGVERTRRARQGEARLSARWRPVRRRGRSDDADARDQEGRALSLLCVAPADHGRQGERDSTIRDSAIKGSVCRRANSSVWCRTPQDLLRRSRRRRRIVCRRAAAARRTSSARSAPRRTSSEPLLRKARRELSVSFDRLSSAPRSIPIASTSNWRRIWSQTRCSAAAVRSRLARREMATIGSRRCALGRAMTIVASA